ncbi:hypothetical protein BgiBS90_017290 [Biomphalaria glabrata]|nr:hypothetical protein BgiBS90_017290 [Biomphalaria glabrata]
MKCKTLARRIEKENNNTNCKGRQMISVLGDLAFTWTECLKFQWNIDRCQFSRDVCVFIQQYHTVYRGSVYVCVVYVDLQDAYQCTALDRAVHENNSQILTSSNKMPRHRTHISRRESWNNRIRLCIAYPACADVFNFRRLGDILLAYEEHFRTAHARHGTTKVRRSTLHNKSLTESVPSLSSR